jgi:hypothetical protein
LNSWGSASNQCIGITTLGLIAIANKLKKFIAPTPEWLCS